MSYSEIVVQCTSCGAFSSIPADSSPLLECYTCRHTFSFQEGLQKAQETSTSTLASSENQTWIPPVSTPIVDSESHTLLEKTFLESIEESHDLNRYVARKCILPHHLENTKILERFIEEAQGVLILEKE